MKRIFTILLLVLVGTALLSTFTEEEPSDITGKTPHTASIVYYFHGSKRCATCNKLESYAKEALDQNFANPMKSGKLYWNSLNFTAPEYEHFVKKFNLSFQMVVLVRYKDGKIVRYQKLDKIWELVGNKEKYQKYIKNETETFFGDLIR